MKIWREKMNCVDNKRIETAVGSPVSTSKFFFLINDVSKRIYPTIWKNVTKEYHQKIKLFTENSNLRNLPVTGSIFAEKGTRPLIWQIKMNGRSFLNSNDDDIFEAQCYQLSQTL